MFGSHLSVAGGLVNALIAARRGRMDCVQVFTRNQRQWRAMPLENHEIELWLSQLQRMGWDSFAGGGPARVVSHNAYLINLAAPDRTIWRKSIEAHRAELERCEALHIPLCVTHPGAHLRGPRPARGAVHANGTITRFQLAGLKRIVRALDAVHKDLPGYRTMTLLETTAGSGTNLGHRFEHLAWIRANVREPQRIGFCFDTCHVTAAGYDMSGEEPAARVIEEFDAACGLENLRAFHCNDSIGARGSRIDRHAHIGQGCCGQACFRTIANHPAFRLVPKLLETPKGKNDKDQDWDAVNLRRLRRLMKKDRL